MRQSITIYFESNAPQGVIERIASRMITQLEYVNDPDPDIEKWRSGKYDADLTLAVVNGKLIK